MPVPFRFFCRVKQAMGRGGWIALALVVMSTPVDAGAPINDDFANATVITGKSGTIVGSLADATREETARYIVGDYARGTVWYKWSASESGLLHLTNAEGTSGIVFAPVVGSAVDEFALVSKAVGPLAVNIVAGETTQIVVAYETNQAVIPDGEFAIDWEFVPKPTVGAPVVNGVMAAGESIEINVTATGEGELSYAWFRDGGVINGATGASFSLPDLSPSMAGKYQVIVSNRGGVARSEFVTVGGLGLGPLIEQQPVGGVVTAGGAITLTVAAVGAGEMSYQWRRHGLDMVGETEAQFTIPAAAMTDTNIYDVVVTDAVGTRASDRVRIAVEPTQHLDSLRFRDDWEVVVEKRGGYIQAVASALDGGFWAAGELSRLGEQSVGQVIRLTPEGDWDPSFVLADQIGGTIEGVSAAGDGEVWVWGSIGRLPNGRQAGGAWRIGATGALLSRIDVAEVGAQYLEDAAVDATGNLYALVRFSTPGKRLVRWLNDGSIDLTYAPSGEGMADLKGLAVTPDGVVFAWSDKTLHRIDATGAVDENLTFDLGEWNTLWKVAVSPSGEVVVLGTTENQSSYVSRPMGIRRLTSEGESLPERLGETSLSMVSGGLFGINHLIVDRNGVPYLSGKGASTGAGHLLRLAPKGEEAEAEELMRFGPWNSSGNTAFSEIEGNFAIGNYDQIVVGGAFGHINGSPIDQLALRRASGEVVGITESVWSLGKVSAIVRQPSGSLVLAGSFEWVNGQKAIGLARVDSEGKFDSSFAVELDISGTVSDLAVDGAGRLLLGGGFVSATGPSGLGRARLSSEGVEDSSFGVGAQAGSARGLIALFAGRSFAVSSGTYWVPSWFTDSGGSGGYDFIDGPARATGGHEQVDGSILITGNFPGSGPRPGTGLLGSFSSIARARLNNSRDTFFGVGNRFTGYFLDSVLWPDESSVHIGSSGNVKMRRHGNVDTTFRSSEWMATSGASAAMALPSGQMQLAGDVSVRWREPEAVDLWQTRYWVRVNANGSVDDTATLEGLDEPVSAMVLREDGNFYVATNGRVRLTEEWVPEIHIQPVGQFLSVGEDFGLRVEASGSELSYQWRKNGTPIPGATRAELMIAAAGTDDQGGYDVVVQSGAQKLISNVAIVVVSEATDSGLLGHHRMDRLATDLPRISRIKNTVVYTGELEHLRWSVVLPQGWSVSPEGDATTAEAESYPVEGTEGLAEWTWTTVPPSGFTFFYRPIPASDMVGYSDVVAMVEVTRAGAAVMGLVTPDPLTVRALAEFHDADVDRNQRLSLSELLRVIELYNTRFGTTRTGRYRVSGDSADGYDPDTSSNEAPTLSRYHAADTSRDGKLSLSELLRVIELYNTRSGTTRTGAYRISSESADGFDAGVGSS